MTSHRPALTSGRGAAPAAERAASITKGDATPANEAAKAAPASSAEESNVDKPSLDSGVMETTILEELTSRLPTSELVKIIKDALECGKRNVPFTETDLLRAMTFGTSSTSVRAPRSTPGARATRR